MYYLVFTTYYDRPYPCKIAFIAHDFESWGCRVDRYPDNSPYIAEIETREKRGNPEEMRRLNVTEIWAREVITRKRESRSRMATADPTVTDDHLPAESRRHARTSGIVQDFIWGLVAFDRPNFKPTTFPPVDPRPLPEWPYALVSTYFRLLWQFRHLTNATLPHESNPNFIVADGVVIGFREHVLLKLAYIAHAVMVAMGQGRIGSVERDTSTGFTKVTLFVEVSDCLIEQCDDLETRDPVPVYERGEYPPAYVSPG